jgi:hypothetical protein
MKNLGCPCYGRSDSVTRDEDFPSSNFNSKTWGRFQSCSKESRQLHSKIFKEEMGLSIPLSH